MSMYNPGSMIKYREALWNDLGSHACSHHRNRRPGTQPAFDLGSQDPVLCVAKPDTLLAWYRKLIAN
jgi:hypothetical protein